MKNFFVLMIVCAMIQIVTDVAVFDSILIILSGVFKFMLNILILIF